MATTHEMESWKRPQEMMQQPQQQEEEAVPQRQQSQQLQQQEEWDQVRLFQASFLAPSSFLQSAKKAGAKTDKEKQNESRAKTGRWNEMV